MNKVTILVQGYAKIHPDGSWEATSTCTLIETPGKKIIMDPGCDRGRLLRSLGERNLTLEEIDYVFLSHRHLDHSMLMGLFPNATIFDDELCHKGPQGKLHGEYLPETDVLVIKTPGHAPRHASLLVTTTDGVIAVSGDVFWWYEGEEQVLDVEKLDDSADGDFTDLKNSRKFLLEKADFIIPGHGKMMKVEK